MAKTNSRKALLASDLGAGVSTLVEQVTEHPGTTFVIGTDGARGTAVLVDAMHYQHLVEKAKTADSSGEKPFRLVGSIEILVSDEELEEGIAARRREQAQMASAKFANL